MFGIRKLTKKIKEPRMIFSTLLEVVGFVALVYGVAVFSMGIAFIVGGILLILAGGLSA
jgi:membrane-bound ClpP family serine protease